MCQLNVHGVRSCCAFGPMALCIPTHGLGHGDLYCIHTGIGRAASIRASGRISITFTFTFTGIGPRPSLQAT